MKIRNIFIIFIILFIASGTVVNAVEPEITATSGAVIDCMDGKFLYMIFLFFTFYDKMLQISYEGIDWYGIKKMY